jgi:hypothetical protein
MNGPRSFTGANPGEVHRTRRGRETTIYIYMEGKTMKIEKYFDLTQPGVEYDINRYLANGWKITHQGLTLIIMEKDV